MFRIPSGIQSAVVPLLIVAVTYAHADEPQAGQPGARAALALGSQPRALVNGVTLIDADRDVPIQPLKNGDTLTLAQLSSQNLNVRVDAEPSVSRVLFSLNEHKRFREETAKPFSLAGDREGDYHPWTPRPGENRLVITPFELGTAGKPVEITFTVESAITPISEIAPVTGSALEAITLETGGPGALTILDQSVSTTSTASAPETFEQGDAAAFAISDPQSAQTAERGPDDGEQNAGDDKRSGRCVGFVNRISGELTVACNHSEPEALQAKVRQVNPDESESMVCDFMNATSPIVTTCPMSTTTIGALHRGRLFVDVQTAGNAAPLTLRIDLE